MTGQKRGPLSTTRDSDLRRGFDRSGPNFSKGTPFSKHPSFAKALEQVPAMNGLAGYLTSSPDIKIFGRQAEIEGLRSSYKDHGYGYLFYGITRVFKPEVCVELGVLQGFSLLTVAAGLRDNGSGEVYGYDLFEEYPYHNDTMANVEQRIRDLSLGDWVHLEQADASQVSPLFDSVDFLHVDISNSGDTYRQVFQQWAHKVKMAMVLEGGREGARHGTGLSGCSDTPNLPSWAPLRRFAPVTRSGISSSWTHTLP